ncbi:MAG: S16 family serine protease [Candidatus Aenigmatarchaeota archaeon]
MKKINVISFSLILISLIILSIVRLELVNILSNQNIGTQLISANKTFEITNITKNKVSLFVPAIDNQGNGVPVKLSVEVLPGEGRVLVDINQILFWIDTQQSIRIAKDVAQNLTKADLSKIDLIYSVETEATIIEGPSAGAALTIATIAAIQNKSVNQSVMITGTINLDGTIGPVGGIIAKSNAAKQIGAKLFLVPSGQGMQTNYKPVEDCKRIGRFTYCRIEYVPERVVVSEVSGIEIREVGNIEEALKYFLT